MKEIIKILKNWEEYKSWKSIKAGKKPVNMQRGAGYYLTLGLIGVKNIGRTDRVKMSSGRTAIAELISYKSFRDPDDMVEESFWHVSGYEGEKLFKDMTFSEYLKSAFNRA